MPSFGPLGLASFAPPSMELQPTRYASLPNLPCMPSLWFFGLASIGIATKEMRFPALHAMPLVLLGLASFTPPSLELQPKTNTHPCPIHPAMPSLWSFRGPLHVRATPSLWLFGLGYVCTSFCGIATRREIRDSTLPARRRTSPCTSNTISLALWVGLCLHLLLRDRNQKRNTRLYPACEKKDHSMYEEDHLFGPLASLVGFFGPLGWVPWSF